MMKRMLIAVAVLVVSVLPAFAEDAQPPQMKESMPQHHEGMMKEMMHKPQHLLIMAYHRNLVTFGRALAKVAMQGETVPREFARTAIAEMRRSVDEMEKYRAEAMQGTPAGMKGHEEMQKMMDEHLVQTKIHLRALEDLAKGDRIASKEVMKDLKPILDGCEKMGRHMMHGKGGHGKGKQCAEEPGCRCGGARPEHCMMMEGMVKRMQAEDAELAKQVEEMKAAPKDKKLNVLAGIVERLVQQHAAMTEHLEKMMQEHRRHEKETSLVSPEQDAAQDEGDDGGEDGDDTDAQEAS